MFLLNRREIIFNNRKYTPNLAMINLLCTSVLSRTTEGLANLGMIDDAD